MTATDPRPDLAATLAAGLAPAAETLAAAYAEDLNAGPPPEDDRALAERHRAGRARLSHLRQLLAVLDWAAAHLPEPEPEPEEEMWDGLDDPLDGPTLMCRTMTAARTSSTMAARSGPAARRRRSSGRGWKTWSAGSGRSR